MTASSIVLAALAVSVPAAAVERLGASDYRSRKAAAAFLGGMDSQGALPVVRGAWKNHRDPEVARAAGAVYRRHRDCLLDELEPMPLIDSAWLLVPKGWYQYNRLADDMYPYVRTAAPRKSWEGWGQWRQATRDWLAARVDAGDDLSDYRDILAEMHRRDAWYLLETQKAAAARFDH